MESVAKADIFFFITTLAVILITVGVVIALAYIIRIAADIKYIAKKAKQETDEIADDIKDIRLNFKEKGKTFGALLSSLWILRGKKKSKQEKK